MQRVRPLILVWRGVPPYPVVDIRREFDRLVDRLANLGDVVEAEPAEIRRTARRETASGRPVTVLTPVPLTDIPTHLGAATVPVVSWPYDRIPDNTARQLELPPSGQRFESFLALNHHTESVLRAAFGVGTSITTVQTPATDRPARKLGADGATRRSAVIVDSDDLEISSDAIRHRDPSRLVRARRWDGGTFSLRFGLAHDQRGLLVGFYNSEQWGAWSRVAEPWILLPRTVSGRVRLILHAHGFQRNVGRPVTIGLGEAEQSVRLPAEHGRLVVEFSRVQPTNVVQFRGLAVSNSGTSTDTRTMGIALSSLQVSRTNRRARLLDLARIRPGRMPKKGADTLNLSGVVYLTSADPRNELSNWSMLVTAFCIAFREDAGATLVVNMGAARLSTFFAEFQLALHRIGRFACRVVVVAAATDASLWHELRQRADYYVTAALGAASSIDVVDTMSTGTPVISPVHTAMSDLVTEGTGFPVRSAAGPCGFPLQQGRPIGVCVQRPDFDSLVEQLQESLRTRRQEPGVYEVLAAGARERSRSDQDLDAALRTILAVPQGTTHAWP